MSPPGYWMYETSGALRPGALSPYRLLICETCGKPLVFPDGKPWLAERIERHD